MGGPGGALGDQGTALDGPSLSFVISMGRALLGSAEGFGLEGGRVRERESRDVYINVLCKV